jgi:ankyrin repeat protein
VFELLAQRFPHLIPLRKNDGMTALDMAAWNNRVEIARILLDKGAGYRMKSSYSMGCIILEDVAPTLEY